MIGLESLRWVLTASFGATCVFHLIRCLRPVFLSEPIGENWVSEALHLLMGVAMTAMIWPWSHAVPPPVWVAVFTASTGWFVARAMRSAGRRLIPAFFATSMAAMIWMGASMPAQAAGHSSAMVHSPAMAMGSGRLGSGRLGLGGWVDGMLGGYLVVAAFWWFFRGLRLGALRPAAPVAGPRPLGWASMCHGLMSIGMGLALLTLL
jgi:hypothetical protein